MDGTISVFLRLDKLRNYSTSKYIHKILKSNFGRLKTIESMFRECWIYSSEKVIAFWNWIEMFLLGFYSNIGLYRPWHKLLWTKEAIFGSRNKMISYKLAEISLDLIIKWKHLKHTLLRYIVNPPYSKIIVKVFFWKKLSGTRLEAFGLTTHVEIV